MYTTQTVPTTQKPEPTQPTQPQRPTDEITLVFGGDLVANDRVVAAGQQDSQYSYTEVFRDVLPVLSAGDAAFINFEGNTYGTSYGTETSTAPAALLQMANSCTITKTNGMLSLEKTLQDIENAGMIPVGAYSDQQKAQSEQGFTLCQIGDIRVAVVGYTKGFDGVTLPQNSQWSVNLLYTDYDSTYKKVDKEGINSILDAVNKEAPDVTIAMLHWGSEFNEAISDTQKDIVSLMKKKGVDVIIGTHPHLVQKVEYDKLAGTLVAYSLGDFFGDGTRGGTNYSIILDVEITKDPLAETTKVTGFDYIPIYTLQATDSQGDYSYNRVVRIREAMLAYENNFVDKISKAAYDSMDYALERIEARVAGEDETTQKK